MKLPLYFAAFAFAFASMTSAQSLIFNGDFELPGSTDTTPINGWLADGPAVVTYPSTGGVGNSGYASMDSTGGWGVMVADAALPIGPATAGSTATFTLDMIGFSGGELAGMKIENWNDVGLISNSGDVKFNLTTSWETYTFDYDVDAEATFLKFVPLSVDGGAVGFDNIGVIPEPSSFALLGGLLALGFMIFRRR